MKKTFRERIREFYESLLPVVKRYPVEMGLMIFTFCCFVLTHEKVCEEWVRTNLLLVPLLFTLAYVLNTLTRNGRRARWWYYLSWLSGVVPWVLRTPVLWVETPEYWITASVLCPLAVLLCRRAVENRSFVRDMLAYISAAVVASVFAWTALGLFLAIFFSIVHIFHIWEGCGDTIWFYSMLITWTLIQPLFFFALLDRMLGREIPVSKLLGNLLNWIVTPALLIYTGILYLYALKITLTWTLPEGKVAYMVFGFTMLALLVKALRLAALKPLCEWFFSRFSLIALPPLTLFWVGTLYRVGEYGLTEPRVWLIVCGLLMSVCVGLFLAQRMSRYLYFCAVAFVVFAAVTYVPALKAKEMAQRSQEARVERIVVQLGLRGALGNVVDKIETVDTTEYELYHKLYESSQYLYSHGDTLALKRTLGVVDPQEFFDRLPAEVLYFARNGVASDGDDYADDDGSYVYLDQGAPGRIDIGNYKNLYTFERYSRASFSFENDTLTLPLPGRPEWRIAGGEFLERQFRKIGSPEGGRPTKSTLQSYSSDLLRFETDSILLILSDMSLEKAAEDEWTISNLNLQLVLTKF